jgi:hypothetical protein
VTSKHILDRIVGRVQISEANSRNTVVKNNKFIDNMTRRKAGDGIPLLKILESHVDKGSATAVRVEEKAVITEDDFKKLMDLTQSPEFAEKYNGNKPIKWSLRDQPEPGREFLTTTEYGQFFIFTTESERGKSSIIIKPRFRKYFSFESDKKEDLSTYQTVLGDLVVFELKIANMDGVEGGEFLEIPGVVFKPRIFVTDAMAEKIKELSIHDEHFEQKLGDLRNSILEVKSNTTGGRVNSTAQVDSMIEAVRFLLAKDPDFFKPQYITTYNRSSYRFSSEGGSSYELTADRGIKVYGASPNISSRNTLKYLSNPPLFQSEADQIFVELKSPEPEKRTQSPLYTALATNVESGHIEMFKKGSGKYAIARRAVEDLFDRHFISTLLEQGTQLWLIKGTANLDMAPKEKDILDNGIVHVAYPFSVVSGRVYRIQFIYRPLNTLNGKKDAILEKIRIIDHNGDTIKSGDKFDEIIQETRDRHQNEILALDLNGTIVPFKAKITHVELVQYQNFFKDFFKNPDRKIEALSDLSDAQNLSWYRIRVRMNNFTGWFKDRLTRAVPVFMVSTLTSLAVVYGNHNVYDAPKEENVKQKQIDVAKRVNVLPAVNGFFDQAGREVPLIATPMRQGGYIFIVSAQAVPLAQGQKTLRLFDKNGLSVEFAVHVTANGNTYLTLN